jgi:drug/metabolite transporter (DMT)-like permease
MTSPLPRLHFAPGKAVAYSLSAVLCLAVLDAQVKWLAADYAIAQIAFLRYVVGVAFAVAVAARHGGLRQLRTRRPFGHALRSILNIVTMLTFYAALKRLPLADVIAIAFAAPLFMTVLSVPLLGERVGWRRWAALSVGFVGVMVTLQPFGDGFNPVGLLAIVSALTYALMLIASRQLSATESSVTILFYYSIGVIVTTGAAMPWQWITPGWADAGLFLACGLVGSVGQLLLNQAFRYGEVSLLAPLEYTALIWAILLGVVVWGEVPTWWVLIGALIVVASSLYIAQREARIGRGAARSAAGALQVPIEGGAALAARPKDEGRS